MARRPEDEGSAIIMVLVALMLLTALGATLTAVTLSNLQGARRSDEATRVLSAAEAGVSQAVTFMRQNGVSTLRCRNVATSDAPSWLDCATPYGSDQPVGPATASPGGARFSVWVEEQTRFLASSPAEGVYVVHSTGTLDDSPHADCQGVVGACRSVTAQVVVTNFGFGTGVYGKSILGNSSGNATIKNQSIFTTGCFPMRGRGSLLIEGFDAAHGIPAGVHTSGIIVDGPASGCDNNAKSIHAADPCNEKFPYDQDSQGGLLETTACWTKIVGASAAASATTNTDVYGKADPVGSDQVWGSKIVSRQGMQETFGLAYPPLTLTQIERLQEIAEEDGTYTKSTSWPTDPAKRGVFFFDLGDQSSKGHGKVPEVDLAAIPAPFDAASGACSGAVVIIRNGNASISPSEKNAVVGASVFLLSSGATATSEVTTGIATLNGGHLYGGLFAEGIDFGGDTFLEPASCADDSSNPALLTINVTSYSEDN